MIDIPAYPLQWPDGLPRARPSTSTPFSTELNKAISNVRASLKKFGDDTGLPIAPDAIVFTSNYGGGLEAKTPKDTGVAVWFEWDKALRCIAIDRYASLAQNVQAIHHMIEADRTKMRYGGLEIVRASFKGFRALPSPKDKRSWRDVLEMTAAHNATKADVEASYRRLAKERHPDKVGGSEKMMSELNAARAEALKEVGP